MSMNSWGWNYKSFALETISITLNQVKEVGVVRTSVIWATWVWTYHKEQRWVRANNNAEGAGDGRCFSSKNWKLSWNLNIDTWWLSLIMWLLGRKTHLAKYFAFQIVREVLGNQRSNVLFWPSLPPSALQWFTFMFIVTLHRQRAPTPYQISPHMLDRRRNRKRSSAAGIYSRQK